jgi:hypothetical protein
MSISEVKVSMCNFSLPKNTKKSGIIVHIGEQGRLSFGQGTIKWYRQNASKPTKSFNWGTFVDQLQK